MKTHNLDTTEWLEFPFSAYGNNYISKIAPFSPFLKQISKLPEGMFEKMNIDAITELVGVNLTYSEIVDRLKEINESSTHAVIELA